MTRFILLLMILLVAADAYLGVAKGFGDNQAFSMAFHFLGGFLAAMLVFSFYNSEFAKLSQPTRLFSIIALTLAIGVFWEFAEYLGNKILTDKIYQAYQYRIYFMGNLDDTVQDLAMDVTGAISFLLVSFGLSTVKKKRSQNPSQ